MDIRKIFIAAASTLSIALFANSANAEWKVMGKSNGGSEIALSTSDIEIDEESGVSDTFFNYRIKTKGVVKSLRGLVDCSVNSDDKNRWWLDHGYVLADSPASKVMLSKVCQIARAKTKNVSVAGNAREVPQRLIKLGTLTDESPLICDKAPYCYLFDAIVDIDSGYLRVWAQDEEGNIFVYDKLYKGDTVKVRQVYQYKGEWRAQISAMRPGCARVSCSAWIDLRYLR
jgi:hypothetical protein